METPEQPATEPAGPFGAPLLRREDLRLAAGDGRYLDDLGHEALAAAFLRSPHAHARIVDIDVTDALTVDGLVAIYTYEDLDGRVAEPLPLLIPHPALHAPRTAYALANGVVQPRRRGRRHGGRHRPLRRRGRGRPDPGRVGAAAGRGRPAGGVGGRPRGAPRRARQRRRPPGADGRRRARGHRRPPRTRSNYACRSSARRSMPLEGKGVYARWDADDRSLRVYSSTQTSTSVRFALAAKLDLPVDRVEVVTPDVGGGFGVKIMHPWPEEVLVPWAAIRLGREVKWVEDRREHFISSAHERGQEHTVRVGFDDEGRILGLDVRFLHDNGAYTPYGIIVPIISSTQLLGPYKPAATGSSSTRSTPTRSSSRRTAGPGGCTAAS